MVPCPQRQQRARVPKSHYRPPELRQCRIIQACNTITSTSTLATGTPVRKHGLVQPTVRGKLALPHITRDNIEGCLLGTALADASGALFEGILRQDLHQQFDSPQAVLNHSWSRQLHYTDDTEMTLVLAYSPMTIPLRSDRRSGRVVTPIRSQR